MRTHKSSAVRRRQQQSGPVVAGRVPRCLGMRGAVAVTIAAIGGVRRADAFFAAPTTTTAMLVGARGRQGRALQREAGSTSASPGLGLGPCGRTRTRIMCMSSDQESAEGDKPQFVPSEAMTTSTKEMLPPPDREAALKMVADREAKVIASGDADDQSYSSADIQDLPKPPYYFKTPGEFGSDTLCTDPKWHTALLAFKWLGLPYEVQHDDDEDEATMVMGDEEYDDPDQLMAGLPERVLLSDFVESLEPVANAISELEPAWTALHFSTVGKTDLDKAEKTLNSCLENVENILLKHGPARGPFVEGDDLTLGDLTLAVTTYHMQVAFGIEKQWTLPDKLVKLKAHMELFHGMQMFEQALPSREDLAKKYALGA